MAKSQLNSNQILDGTITNSDISSDIADRISGSKVTPNFGAQDIVTTGTISCGAQGFYLGPISGNPSTLTAGLMWFDTATAQFKGYNGTQVIILG